MASGGGEIWITWAAQTEAYPDEPSIFASHWNGFVWNPEVNVITPDSIIPAGGFNLAVDHNGQPHLVWTGMYQGNQDIYYTTYDGASWIRSIQINVPDGGEQDLDPAISVDSIGHLHVVWAARTYGTPYGYGICYSRYDGTNWSEEIEISTPDDLGDYRARIVAGSTDNVWVVWDGVDTTGEYHIYTVRFDETGWSDEEQLDSDDTDFDHHVWIALDRRASPWVVWVGSIQYGAVNLDIFYNRYHQTGIQEQMATRENAFFISQNYPSPFQNSICIQYELPRSDNVCVTIYNLLGQEVRILIDEHQSAGPHTITWDATDNSGRKVPSGAYLLRLEAHTRQAGIYSATRKVCVVR